MNETPSCNLSMVPLSHRVGSMSNVFLQNELLYWILCVLYACKKGMKTAQSHIDSYLFHLGEGSQGDLSQDDEDKKTFAETLVNLHTVCIRKENFAHADV